MILERILVSGPEGLHYLGPSIILEAIIWEENLQL